MYVFFSHGNHTVKEAITRDHLLLTPAKVGDPLSLPNIKSTRLDSDGDCWKAAEKVLRWVEDLNGKVLTPDSIPDFSSRLCFAYRRKIFGKPRPREAWRAPPTSRRGALPTRRRKRVVFETDV